jgi:hypothetical protein
MAKYTATIRLLDLEGADRVEAKRVLDEKLQAGAVGRYQVVAIESIASPLPVRRLPPRNVWLAPALGPILLLGALLSAVLFYWYLID